MMSIKTILILIAVFVLLSAIVVWKFFLQGVDQSIKEDIEKGNAVVLLFSAHWCSSCKEQKPAYEVVKKEFSNIHFYEVTSEINRVQQKLMFKRYNIHGIPTFVLFKNAKEFKRVSGLQTEETLRESFSAIN